MVAARPRLHEHGQRLQMGCNSSCFISIICTSVSLTTEWKGSGNKWYIQSVLEYSDCLTTKNSCSLGKRTVDPTKLRWWNRLQRLTLERISNAELATSLVEKEVYLSGAIKHFVSSIDLQPDGEDQVLTNRPWSQT